MKKFLIAIIMASCFSVSADQWVEIGGKQVDLEHEARVKKVQKIILEAQKEWPDDYSLQMWQINKQVKAMENMEQVCKNFNVKI